MKPIRKKEENTMQLPKEMKGPSCTHEPPEWTECARCIENYYLKQLAAEQTARVALGEQLTNVGEALQNSAALLRATGTLLRGSAKAEDNQSALERYNAEDSASTVFAVLKRGKERSSGAVGARAPFDALRELVDTWVSLPRDSQTWISCGRGKAFSVLRDAPPFTGSTRDEVVERVLIAVLNELETQKAALETRVGLLEGELERTQGLLLAAELEADHLDVSWRSACADRQAERRDRRELLFSSELGRGAEAHALLDFPEPAERRPYVERRSGGASMLKTYRNSIAQTEALGLLAQKLNQQKDTAYAERNELAALVVQMARALGLPAGRREDADAEEGWRTLLVVQFPTGQVSWHLPDRERGLVDRLPLVDQQWDNHSKAEARQRIREAILGGFPAWSLAEKAPAAIEDQAGRWRRALAGTALKQAGGAPCWCLIDWRGLRPSNHGEGCERLTALLHEMIKAEEGA